MSQKKNINRRQFLRGATGVVAGAIGFPYIVPSSALGKAGTVAPGNRISIGCIGTGGMGTSNMYSFLGKSEVQVVAVCDVNRESSGYWGVSSGWHEGIAGREPARRIVEKHYAREKQSGVYKGCAAYSDFRELLARDDIDAVSIAIPDHWHAIVAVMAARAGKDIYGEKPLAYTIDEGRAICDAVKRYGVVWQTGSWQRSERKFRFACELVRNGRIGRVHTVKIGLPYGHDIQGNPETKPAPVPEGFDYDMWLGPAPWAPYCPGRCHYNFRYISDYSGGEMIDWGAHYYDIAQWGMDTEYTAAVEIEGRGVFPKAEDGLYDTAESYRFVCKYAEGFTIIVADTSQFSMGVRFEGTDGWIHISREDLSAHPESILDSVIRPNEIHLYESNDHIANFIDCVKNRAE
ncbi:MAG: Gfo/Idh/MocA family oxidoreductase, partial [Planctomycetes bacterium]|nr:Gfo/Idh/MocA family oxidoreductase [Planctomycetota bacterium]